MKIKKIIAVVAAVSFLMAGAAHAQPREGSRLFDHKKFKETMIKELGLTPGQDQKLEENRKAQDAAMKKFHEEMKQQQDKLKDALKSPEATRVSVEPIVAQMKLLQAQLIDQRISGIFSVKSILTPEQFTKFNEMIEKHFKGKRGHFRGKGDKMNEEAPSMSQEGSFEEPLGPPPPDNEPPPEPSMNAEEEVGG